MEKILVLIEEILVKMEKVVKMEKFSRFWRKL